MPPPTMRVSTLPSRLSSRPSLVETLEPPMMAISGRAGASSTLAKASSSAAMSGPAQATLAARTAPSVEEWARWAAPKASMT